MVEREKVYAFSHCIQAKYKRGFSGTTFENIWVPATNECNSDMANIDVDWEVQGVIQADESVMGMLGVIGEKGPTDSGSFWCWDGRVSTQS